MYLLVFLHLHVKLSDSLIGCTLMTLSNPIHIPEVQSLNLKLNFHSFHTSRLGKTGLSRLLFTDPWSWLSYFLSSLLKPVHSLEPGPSAAAGARVRDIGRREEAREAWLWRCYVLACSKSVHWSANSWTTHSSRNILLSDSSCGWMLDWKVSTN